MAIHVQRRSKKMAVTRKTVGKVAGGNSLARAAGGAQKKPGSGQGVEKTKAVTGMTTEQWRKLQVGMPEKWPAPAYMEGPREGRSHTSYRDETYEVVTRWSAETKIRYRPHAKAPGSKSHVHYEEYSRARTVAEALKLGSFPADWCWDYERGFIKVLGPMREEPLDISKVTSERSLTEVDRIIHRWHRRELARNLGLRLEDLSIGKGSGESLIMRAHRLVAQREAKAALEAARRERRKVREEEVLKVLRAWRFARNTSRLNVLPEGQDWVFSDTLGLLRDRTGDIHLTPATRSYPEVVQLFNQYLLDRLPQEVADFKWTTINVNCNYSAKLHRDGNNFGPSFIKAFGDFSDGLLKYWPEDDKAVDKMEDLKEADAVTMDLKRSLGMFNGYCAHYVQPFRGERYTVVFFSVGCHSKTPEDRKESLRELGMQVPAPDEDPHALLRAPRGYRQGAGDWEGGAAATSRKRGSSGKGMPSFRAYPISELEAGAASNRRARLAEGAKVGQEKKRRQ